MVMLGEREPDGMISPRGFDALGEQVDDGALITRVEGRRVRDPALILYTVRHDLRAARRDPLPRGLRAHAGPSTGRVWGTRPATATGRALPLYHVTALGCLTWVLGVGATFISDYSWDAGRALAPWRPRRRPSSIPAYQPVMEDLISHPDFATTDLSRIRDVPQRRAARGAGQVPGRGSRTRSS